MQDGDGRTVGIGSTARTVPPALRRALMVRDGRCRFGDCTARRFLHGHHIDHWPAPTEMGNLAMVCYQHHHALHEDGWTLVGDPFGELVATHPDGRSSPPNWPRDDPRTLGPPASGPPRDVGPPGAAARVGATWVAPAAETEGTAPTLFDDDGDPRANRSVS